MKESITFIKGKINELFSEFPTLKIRYEFRSSIGTHLIEILPVEEFDLNDEYILFETSIENEFEELFGAKEDILFISSDSLNEIEDSELSLGYNFIEKIKAAVSISHTFNFVGLELNDSLYQTSYALAA